MPRIHEYFLFTLKKYFILNLFNLSLKFNGFPIEKAKLFLKSIQNKNDDDYCSYLEAQKQAIVSYHLEHNSFYKLFAKNINPLEWENIPVMTKRDLQQPLLNRLSEGFLEKNIHKHKTSGSSGEPFVFAKDKFCHALTWAGFMNRYNWFNIDLNSSKQARFYGIQLDKKGYYKERLKDRLSKRYRFSTFDLSEDQFDQNLAKFKTTNFDYINGYTSAIVQFAKYLKRKNIVLKTICPSLKICIVTSEMLFTEDKNLLETQFGIPIINEYGAAELGLIAFENTLNQWVINSEDLYVEILDENNKVLPNGEEGRIVITSLYNKAHPFIRYDLGDIGVLSKMSTIKTPILEKLIGRTNDIVKLPSGKTAAGLTFYYITKTVIEEDANVKEFIIEQLKLDTFKITYTSNNVISNGKKQDIINAIGRYLESGLTVDFEQKRSLDRSNRGKLKQFTTYL